MAHQLNYKNIENEIARSCDLLLSLCQGGKSVQPEDQSVEISSLFDSVSERTDLNRTKDANGSAHKPVSSST